MKDFFKKIDEILNYADSIVLRNEANEVFFRGVNRQSYGLLPGLARIKADGLDIVENRMYYDFVNYGGHLTPQNKNTWDILFLMQHHGLPTRLLDWTESLLTALYFATKDTVFTEDAAIWVLDPYGLNELYSDNDSIDYLDVSYPEGYFSYFVDETSSVYRKFPKSIIAIGVNPPNSRIVAQKGAFTFHNPRSMRKPLEEFKELSNKNYLQKFIIERSLFNDARKFLMYSNMNEFSMFPDLDGLARYINMNERFNIQEYYKPVQEKKSK
ncbi:MAG TPA: FRG domain-containing protein [Bacteroidales bacterium]|nr:FRG domain-containing protein [Bacteroidales bacterium]